MKKILSLFILLSVSGFCMAAKSTKAKHKKAATSKNTKNNSKSKATTNTNSTEYTGPLLKVSDAKSDNPGLAGFNADGYYKITVLQTVTPASVPQQLTQRWLTGRAQ